MKLKAAAASISAYLQHVWIPPGLAPFPARRALHGECSARLEKSGLASLLKQTVLAWSFGGEEAVEVTWLPPTHIFFVVFFCLSGQDMGRSKARFTVYTIYHFKVLQKRNTLIFVMISLWSSAAASLCDMSSGSSRALWDGAASKALPSASRSLVQREQGRRSCQCCCVGSKCQFREWTELSSDLFCREGVRRWRPPFSWNHVIGYNAHFSPFNSTAC